MTRKHLSDQMGSDRSGLVLNQNVTRKHLSDQMGSDRSGLVLKKNAVDDIILHKRGSGTWKAYEATIKLKCGTWTKKLTGICCESGTWKLRSVCKAVDSTQ